MNLSMPPFPPDDHLFVDRNTENMVKNGDNWLGQYTDFSDAPLQSVLDIGCGYGRLAYALHRSGFGGAYHGMDILKKQIDWLRTNFTPSAAKYTFSHLDIKNDRYNKTGTLSADQLVLPTIENLDLVMALSVFTHMYEDDIDIYLKKIREIMSDNTIFYCTFFLMNPQRTYLDASGKAGFPMKNQLNEHCWFSSEDDPLHAIAYDESWVKSKLLERGLYPVAIYYAKIPGHKAGRLGQDILFVAKL